MVGVFTLTPQAAAQALQDNGLDALGITGLKLSNTWGGANPAFDPSTLRLTPSGNAAAPYRGILEYLDDGAVFRDVNGAPIAGPVAAFRLHPQAVARLDTLMARFAAPGQPHHRLVPEALVFTGAVPAPDRSPQTYEPGEALPRTEPMSFHDNRGLIIDPIAVAAIFADLVAAFPALDHSGGAGTGGAGGVASIAGLASGVVAQVTDLHGRVFAPVTGGPSVEKRDSGDNPAGPPDAQGLVSLGANETLAGSGSGAADRLRIGWATGGTMDAGPLSQPASPVTLGREFFRAYAVDLDWHLLGNRTEAAERGVPAEDGDMPNDLKPQVRDGVTIDYPLSGPDLFAHCDQVLARLNGAPGAPLVFAVAPRIEDGVRTPAAPGAAARWPAFPAPNTAAGFAGGTAGAVLTGATAAWTSGEDVVVTLAANAVPDGAAVRIYPQMFQLIESIGEAPSFIRGDGGASVAASGVPTTVLVQNPLGLAPGDPKPTPANLVFDLVVTPRTGPRRLFGARTVDIAAGPAAVPPDIFAPVLDRMAAIPDQMKGISLAPLFGLERSTAPGGGPSTALDLVRALASESEPREGPRMPTMGRLESVIVTGIGNAANLSDGLDWNAVLSGVRWDRGSVSARHRDGNPGNPAGPDTHATGVRVDGALGYDLARHAVRRAQPILPLPGGAPPGTSPGWIVMSGGNNMNPPAPSGTPAPPGTSSGALLQTVAAVCETPELSLLPNTTPLASNAPITFDDLLDAIAAGLGIPSPAGSITVANEDRLINEVRREYFLSTHGSRDALWSLARAFSEAEELVYIETAGLARTSRGGGAAHNIDLIDLLATRLGAQPNLKVVIATPRETDFVPAPFVRQAIAQREEAVNMLATAAPGRVAAFHPRGFPGRHAVLPTTNVIVDDIWSMTGATHLRRRGMTFDGSAAVASLDRTMAQGYSAKIQTQRQGLMAAKLGVTRTDAAGLPTPEFLRLARPASAFDLISDLLQQNGLGMISPLWLGPDDSSVLPQSDDVADPDGTDGGSLALLLGAFLSEA
ncbi:hypothetical protein QO034_14515 [Sedimentitalea sp. JM2-8]|uniref:Uncharacterized protein n=1 Tax=Sedimentitalea xiamensis TaxID=3050037 RepID=A0ABT7FGS1_9RHOB|nr:hypothetical protein [Sedimentitalea xiamensis]MDK3074317.1 hypothetical protein [Sedimentitalea xiamensis]